MKKYFSIAIVVMGLLGCAHVENSAVVDFTIADCNVGAEGFATECGAMNVYENRVTKTGRIIPINFVRVRATDGDGAGSALIELTGGPGENASQSAARRITNSKTLGMHDFVIVDQRGTGKSNPLDCVKFDLASKPEAFAEMFEKGFFDADRFRACEERLSAHADLTQYTTRHNCRRH